MRVVLASTSRYRRELVERLALDVECVAPPYDEEAAKAELAALAPDALVAALARGKARSVAALRPDALVIGSDQAVDLDGELLGKPGTEEVARARLRRLAGRAHRLVTAVAVVDGATGRTEEALSVHDMVLRDLTAREIEDYVRRDLPLDCAGAYRVETLGIALFERVTGDDFTAIIGLPLTRVTSLLARFGVRVLGGA
jgi:septum formation protein